MTQDERDDAALLRAHIDGDSAAFGVLVQRHRDRLWAVAIRTMGNREDAADGLQDGLVAAYRRAATFRGEAAVSTWLHKVVVNACLDRLRAAKVRRADPLPDDLDQLRAQGPLSPAGPTTGDPVDHADPAETVLQADRRALVLDALRTLPVEQRAALVLVDMEGYSVAEAAEILDCAPGTVKSRCSRGRTRLAGLLRPLLDRPDDTPRRMPSGNPTALPAVATPDTPRGPPPTDPT